MRVGDPSVSRGREALSSMGQTGAYRRMGLVSSKKRRGYAAGRYSLPQSYLSCIRTNPSCRGFVLGFGHLATGAFQSFLE